MAQRQDIAQQQERITHISNFMLCRPVAFVNACPCFNPLDSDWLAGIRNTVHCATRRRNTLGYMDPVGRGERLAHGAVGPGVVPRQ